MTDSQLAKVKATLKLMEDPYWPNIVDQISILNQELEEYLKPAYQMFIDLMVAQVDLCEAKYKGYNALVDNCDDTDKCREIMNDTAQVVKDYQEYIKKLEYTLSELIPFIEDFLGRIMNDFCAIPDPNNNVDSTADDKSSVAS